MNDNGFNGECKKPCPFCGEEQFDRRRMTKHIRRWHSGKVNDMPWCSVRHFVKRLYGIVP